MKFITLFLTTAIFTSYANSTYSQNTKASVDLHNVTIERFIDEIESTTQFRFVYKVNDVDLKRKISISLKDEPIGKILDNVFNNRNISFSVLQNQIYLKKKKPKEKSRPAKTSPIVQFSVSGTVVDVDGVPLPGASILEKGTTNGATSDFDGNYTISLADENGALTISYIGFKTQEVAVSGQSEIDITLEEDAAGLEEVVVVGYGSQKKSVVTGSISSVKSDDLENQQVTRVEDALKGRASGLTVASTSGAPGVASTVRIRGTTSLNEGASNPLYVVDGVVVGTGGIDYLNSSDIESIEVLKDAASAAIYGARSSAGVILVTTKQGKSGSLKVSYNGYYGLQAPAHQLDLLNATQYAQLINEQSLNSGEEAIFSNVGAFGQGTDWQKVIFDKSAVVQNNELSISGGSERSTFYTSFGYYNQDGIVASEISNFKRYNIRINATHKIKDWLTLGHNIGYSNIKSLGGVGGNTNFGGPLSSAIMMDPITPIIETDPGVLSQTPYSNQPVVLDDNGNPYGISPYIAQQVTNPLAYVKTERGNYTWSDDIVGNAFLEISPIEGLTLRSTLGGTLSYAGGEFFTPIFYLNSNQNVAQTSFSRNRGKVFNWNLENTLAYNKVLGNHDFTVLLGQGAYLDNNNSGLAVTYFNLPVETFDEASLNYSTSAEDIDASGYEGIQHRVNSLFGRLTYNFGEKYLFTGLIRRDGSSRFGENNKYGYFPSASAGWVISKEEFWPFENAVQFLKLRASYGVTGNDVLGNFRFLSTVGGGRNYSFGFDNYLIGYSPDAPANPDLKWEETTQLNLGFDAKILSDFSLSFDWYRKETNGILQALQLPGYVGATGTSFGNVADMENRGFELEFGYQKQMADFGFEISANGSYLENEVTFLGDGKDFLDGGTTLQSSNYPITRTAVGQPIGAFFGFKTNGIFQTEEEVAGYVGPSGNPIQPDAVPGDFRWTDSNDDGIIDEEDRTFIGNPIPKWNYGLTLKANWKNLDLLVFGQGVSGNDIFQGVRRLDIPTANWQVRSMDRWTGPGTSEVYPRLSLQDGNNNFSNPSDFFLEKGNYFRIKTLQFGFNFPKRLLDNSSLGRLRLYASATNLITLTDYSGFDPEIGGDSYSIDRAIYPQARSIMLGVNLVY
ncbi:MAG TPA: SusC/RagA family TonB-linked outer membrane protein [Pricia antarctica]|uniref:SusC/RagA family TonB-linked outer membrane protein n=2 Tax=root TaxID=1 RepID=A0A831VRJ9_9FLAO|nr:SusC/RagA family TonB-linked outer membrane protein [Pricia antarctica]